MRNHITNIFSRLQVADRAEAVIQACEAGLCFLGLRPHVLVEPEQVVRIVLALERREPPVLGAKGAAHHLIPFLLEASKVEIAATV